MTIYQIIGLYPIVPSIESIKEAARFHGYDWLFDEQGNYADTLYWENHENLSLLEMQISGVFTSKELLVQISHGDQAP